jgi:hypothetical protein
LSGIFIYEKRRRRESNPRCYLARLTATPPCKEWQSLQGGMLLSISLGLRKLLTPSCRERHDHGASSLPAAINRPPDILPARENCEGFIRKQQWTKYLLGVTDFGRFLGTSIPDNLEYDNERNKHMKTLTNIIHLAIALSTLACFAVSPQREGAIAGKAALVLKTPS